MDKGVGRNYLKKYKLGKNDKGKSNQKRALSPLNGQKVEMPDGSSPHPIKRSTWKEKMDW